MSITWENVMSQRETFPKETPILTEWESIMGQREIKEINVEEEGGGTNTELLPYKSTWNPSTPTSTSPLRVTFDGFTEPLTTQYFAYFSISVQSVSKYMSVHELVLLKGSTPEQALTLILAELNSKYPDTVALFTSVVVENNSLVFTFDTANITSIDGEYAKLSPNASVYKATWQPAFPVSSGTLIGTMPEFHVPLVEKYMGRGVITVQAFGIINIENVPIPARSTAEQAMQLMVAAFIGSDNISWVASVTAVGRTIEIVGLGGSPDNEITGAEMILGIPEE